MARPGRAGALGLSWGTRRDETRSGNAKEPRQRSRRDVSVSESEGTSAVSEFKVVNPATNETEREFAAATDAEVERVLASSARAYQSWWTTAKDERTKVLQRVAELYKERIDDLAALITREMGKPTREAKGEILLVVSIYRYYADQGPALLEDTPLSPRAGGTADRKS